MADTGRYGIAIQLDITQILLEAQNRWLRPAEICEILRNYRRFRIAPEPPHMPPSGSLFLFDRKVLRYFRKDGHNWRKKRDGKTVKEAHERLKAGSIDVLHCYYAHGEENENFQRRSYWMLEEELSHIVLVHYREVKGGRTNFNRSNGSVKAFPSSQETEGSVPNPEMDTSVSSKYQPSSYQSLSQNTDTASLNSAQASEYEDVESVYNHQEKSGFQSFVELQHPALEKTDIGSSVPFLPVPFSNDYDRKFQDPHMDFSSLAQEENYKFPHGATLAYGAHKQLDLPSWEDMLENCTAGLHSVPFQSSVSPAESHTSMVMPKLEKEIQGQILMDDLTGRQEFSCYERGQEDWQITSNRDLSCSSVSPASQLLPTELTYDLKASDDREKVGFVNLHNSLQPCEANRGKGVESNNQVQCSDLDYYHVLKSDVSHVTIGGKASYSSAAKHHVLDPSRELADGLNKLDSFNRWMSKELGDVDDSHIQSSSGTYWDTVGSENGVDDPSISPESHLESYTLPPSLSHDQLFSIIDFSPTWAYAGSETKVLIMGKFLKNQSDIENCKWSCMFGEVEVPAEILAHGVLRCYTPLHKTGRVPFYVTCSNRVACSEVREFEYKISSNEDVDVTDVHNVGTDHLQLRLARLLTISSVHPPVSCSNLGETSHSLLKVDDHDEWVEILKLSSEEKFLVDVVKDQLLEKILKENLQVWLLQRIAEGGKGPGVLDQGGQGVLHLAAALGYDWALPPTVVSGVSVNFRDVNGWTALHWAASCGRERTVVSLLSLGAAPGALTDPTPTYPSGKTPADIASANGHKGISGLLAEITLSVQLSSLDLKDAVADTVPSVKAIQAVAERTATPTTDGDLLYGLSLKDSLAAVSNATQTAARIHQAFRVQSFRRKQIIDYGDNEFGLSDERALSLIALKTHKPKLHDEPVHAAAVRIQNKFRSYKGRKDFLITRQRIVRIQAHFRGHQVRKNYKKIIWSVGIVEKVILRWRRKGSGLRGFRPETLGMGPNTEGTPSKEDDYDFLKEGRKQTEERLQKALARVKSMAQYPEGRDQYRRLLTVVTEIQETKVMPDYQILGDSEEIAAIDDDLIDLEELLGDDDSFMPLAY